MASTAPRIGVLERSDDHITLPVAAATTIYAGTLVAINASGYAVPASASASLTVIGLAHETVTNAGSAGARSIEVRLSNGRRSFKLKNSSSSVGIDDIGKTCYVVDNDTVSMTSTDTCAAGTVTGVESGIVWVRFVL